MGGTIRRARARVVFHRRSATIRLQVREDGLSFDQIILSPERFLTTAPVAAKHEATIYPKQP
jgi:hypothetical protein